MRVGPGLNQGYNSNPAGGFAQNNTRDFIMPKSVDQKRVLTNPKLSFKGRILPGRGLTVEPKKIGAVQKYKPDTFGIHGPERYFTTVGAITKEKKKACIIMKDTNRKNSRQYHGAGAPATKKAQKTRII